MTGLEIPTLEETMQLISSSAMQVSKALSENIEIICIYCNKNCQLNADEILS